MRPHLVGCLGRIEAETDLLGVVRGAAHGVESVAGDLVCREVVNSVAPQHEAGASFSESDLDSALVSRAGLPNVEDHHGDSREFQLPVFVGGGFEVEVGEGAAYVYLEKRRFIFHSRLVNDVI